MLLSPAGGEVGRGGGARDVCPWQLRFFSMSRDGAWQEYETPRLFLRQNGSLTAGDVTNTKP